MAAARTAWPAITAAARRSAARVGESEDAFVLQHRLPDGRTVLDRFVAARGELPRAERDMLRAWTDVVERTFELEVRDDDGVVATNVIDDLLYNICSNMGPAAFDPDSRPAPSST